MHISILHAHKAGTKAGVGKVWKGTFTSPRAPHHTHPSTPNPAHNAVGEAIGMGTQEVHTTHPRLSTDTTTEPVYHTLDTGVLRIHDRLQAKARGVWVWGKGGGIPMKHLVENDV